MTLLLSILALIAGPFIYALGRKQPDIRQILDGFVFITVAGIVCVFIIPQAISAGGFLAIGFLLLGLAFPVVIERTFERSMHEAHVFILFLAALGLVVHAIVDGIALLPTASADGSGLVHGGELFAALFDNHLAVGVILHRLPVGMAIWWSVRSSFGVGAAVGTFVTVIVATAFAYLLGQPIVELAEAPSIAWLQAFVSGSLVHVVAFGISHDHDEHEHVEPATSAKDWGYRVGILLGMFFIFTAPHIHG